MEIFVFGSNLGGIHGAGAALTAKEKYGAEIGNGVGRQGNAYAIPTKDKDIMHTLPLPIIQAFVDAFCEYAKWHDEDRFIVTQIGCGLAGLKPKDIAPMFNDAPSNCLFDRAWAPYLKTTRRFWGTYK